MLRWLATFVVSLCSARALGKADYRQQPCKSDELVPTCVRIHGRLEYGNGTPSTRLWQIGTHHVYGIYSNRYGFIHDDPTLDNETPELHFRLPKDLPDKGGWTVYGDFEICPLERHTEGHMQAACIADATHIVVPKQ